MAAHLFQRQLTAPGAAQYNYIGHDCAQRCSRIGVAAGRGGLAPYRRLGHRHAASTRAAAASDWNYGGYGAPTDWSVTAGAYVDPRVAAAGPPRQYMRQDGPPDGPSTSYDSMDGVQDADPLSEIARSAVEAVAGCLAFLVGRLSDAALSLLPPHVKRRAVENSVKGGLALVGLALLQSVLALVLTVGTMVLAVYAAHQVFGLRLPFLPPAAGGRPGPGTPPDGAGFSGQADPRFYGAAGYGPYGAAQSQPGYQYGGAGPTSQGYRPPRPGPGYGDRGQPYPPRPGAGGGPGGQWRAGSRQGQGQGPTIDVFHDAP